MNRALVKVFDDLRALLKRRRPIDVQELDAI